MSHFYDAHRSIHLVLVLSYWSSILATLINLRRNFDSTLSQIVNNEEVESWLTVQTCDIQLIELIQLYLRQSYHLPIQCIHALTLLWAAWGLWLYWIITTATDYAVVHTDSHITICAEACVARQVTEVFLIVFCHLSNSSWLYRNLNSIQSANFVLLGHREYTWASRRYLTGNGYRILATVVDSHSDWFVVLQYGIQIHFVPSVFVCLKIEATIPAELLCISTIVICLHINTECKWIVSCQLNHQLCHIRIDEFANCLEEYTWNAETKLTMVNWFAQYLCRNLSLSTGQDTILAIYCHTSRQGNGIAAQVLECESRSLTHIRQQVVRELIPSGACFVYIALTGLHLYVVDTVQWLFNGSINQTCTQFQFVACNHSYIYIIDRISSHKAIVNHFINAHTWQYRYDCRCNHLEWASERSHRSHPYNLVSRVSKGQLEVLA